MTACSRLVGIAAIGFVGAASGQWHENGKPAPDTTWRKAWGEHGAMLQLTDRPDELFAAWEKSRGGVPISTVEVAKRGEPIVGVVLFSGCTPNKAGVCETQADFQVFKPDGSAYDAEEKTELWSGKPPPPQGQLQLGVGAIGVRIEPQDPNGTYTVRARLRDKVSQAEVELTTTFRVDPPVLLMVLPFGALAEQTAPIPQAGYSTALLHDPIFDRAQVAVETVGINNWLNGHYQSLSVDAKKGPREHIYYLIDSKVKDLFAATGRVMPAEHDIELELLFSWAERLDVYGGSIVYNALRHPSSPEQPQRLPLPAGFSLTLNSDLLELRSEAGRWSVAFPYYFMIGRVAEFDAKNGFHTQLVIISTGAAKDVTKTGYSQATLMLMFSPEAEPLKFATSWRELLTIPADKPMTELGVRELRARHHYDADAKLHKELTTWSSESGEFAVAYSGMDGTYQWNRAHFLDFLRALHVD